MLTLDQKYGIAAHKSVQAIKEQEDARKKTKSGKEQEDAEEKTESAKDARKYGVMCHKLPILIHTAGLAQALAFVDSRKGDIYQTFLKDLGETLEEKDIVTTAREANLNDYMRLTAQVMGALVWYKRFAQSILGVDVSDTDVEDGK